jgi:xylulose-5-phosphate/fructose-6-phosphate phosphoketolase
MGQHGYEGCWTLSGPLATSWHSNKFLNPARDGAVLRILHLNGYKIGNPTVLGTGV